MSEHNGWHPQRLIDLAEYINGYAFKPEHWGKDGLKIIRIEQLKNPEAPSDYYSGRLPSACIIDNGDLLFSWSASLFLKIWKHGRAALNQHLFKVIERDGVDREFLKQFIDFHLPELAKASHGSTMQHITRKELERFRAPFPDDEHEQSKIAEILSTVDRAIEQTEALIAKQQRIKTGLMQDLLTRGIDEQGNLRSEETHQFKDSPLGRIPVEWTPSTLGEVGTWSSGGTPSKSNPQFWGGTVPWVSPKDMKTFDLGDTIDRITEAGARFGSRMMPAGTIFIVIRGMILAHTFPVCFATRAMTFNQDVKAITAREGVSSRFLAYWLAANDQTMLKITTTATHGTKRFDMDDLYGVDIALPKESEQELTAKALDDMQEQILVTRSHLGKLQSLKTALMQDLLTGEKRVTPLLEPAVTT